MTILPEAFVSEMKEILKSDYPLYEESINKDAYRGISVNRLKAEPQELIHMLPFQVSKSPFYRDGYYINTDESGIGKLPLHHAGAFYVQEPSASSAVSLLDVQEGDRVLDLCAAPGGKSAQIASCLNRTGLLWSNEVVKNRAQILLSNFERMGIPNGVVSSCYPDVLCKRLEGAFDKVLVDAPCSGEGMFRKNPEAVGEWSREHVLSCAERQLSILNSAAMAVRDGGILVYSTCTFSYEENEGVVSRFLSEHPEFEMCDISEPFGRKTQLPCAVRITPIEGGEGHFAAKLRRRGEALRGSFFISGKAQSVKDSRMTIAKKELSDIFKDIPEGRYEIAGDKLYIMPEEIPELGGLNVIRAGVLAGEFRKNRFEPAHSLFMSSPPDSFRRVLDLCDADSRVYDFLHGMETDCETENGYTAVLYSGIVMGFGKCSDHRLKNKYPKGLRI